jgi:predicted nucleotidyltransferase
MMAFGLDDQVVEKVRAVLAGHSSVEKAVIYGSRAKNSHKPGSDIDLNLQGEDITAAERDRIILELDELNLPYSIDVTVYQEIKHDALKSHIKRVGAVLYNREEKSSG